MQWYVTLQGDTIGPHEGQVLFAKLRELVATGQTLAGAHVRDDSGGNWMPIEQSPFASAVGAAPAVAQAPPSETLGTLLLLLPIFGTVLVWLWVGSMNLLQDPATSLLMVSVAVVLVSAVLIATEAAQLGMGKVQNSKGKVGTGPAAWFILTLLLWVVALPWYLFDRSRYGRKNLIVGGVLGALVFMGSYLAMSASIETQKENVRQKLDALRNIQPPF